MSIEVKPHGEHGKKKWCVCRDGVVLLTCNTNSEACGAAQKMAEAYEAGQVAGKKEGVAEGKKKATVTTPPPAAVSVPATR